MDFVREPFCASFGKHRRAVAGINGYANPTLPAPKAMVKLTDKESLISLSVNGDSSSVKGFSNHFIGRFIGLATRRSGKNLMKSGGPGRTAIAPIISIG